MDVMPTLDKEGRHIHLFVYEFPSLLDVIPTNQFIVITDEELIGLKSEREEKLVEILGFVQLKEIDPVFYDKTYYIAADTNGPKAIRCFGSHY